MEHEPLLPGELQIAVVLQSSELIVRLKNDWYEYAVWRETYVVNSFAHDIITTGTPTYNNTLLAKCCGYYLFTLQGPEVNILEGSVNCNKC